MVEIDILTSISSSARKWLKTVNFWDIFDIFQQIYHHICNYSCVGGEHVRGNPRAFPSVYNPSKQWFRPISTPKILLVCCKFFGSVVN